MSQNSTTPGDRESVIRTDRLVLRPVVVDDAAFLVELMNDEAFLRFIGDRNVRTRQQAANYVRTTVHEQSGGGNRLFAVTLAEDRRPIGVCSFLKREQLEFPDIGFAFLPAFRGQGYALEATRATLDFVRQFRLATQVLAVASPDNEKSILLLERLGFQPDGEVQLTPEGPACKRYTLHPDDIGNPE